MYPPFGGYGPYGNYNLGLYGALVPYGTLNLTVASPPQAFTEPFSLAEAKSFLRLPSVPLPFTSQDDDLTAMIIAARVQAELAQCRDLVVKQYDLLLDYWPGFTIELRPDVRSVDLVQLKDSTGALRALVEGTDYVVDKSKRPGVITPPWNVVTWPVYTPWPSSSLLIRFTCGLASDDMFWSDTGATVKMGMRRLISEWFLNRLPLAMGKAAMEGYPDVITAALSYGAVPRVR